MSLHHNSPILQTLNGTQKQSLSVVDARVGKRQCPRGSAVDPIVLDEIFEFQCPLGLAAQIVPGVLDSMLGRVFRRSSHDGMACQIRTLISRVCLPVRKASPG